MDGRDAGCERRSSGCIGCPSAAVRRGVRYESGDADHLGVAIGAVGLWVIRGVVFREPGLAVKQRIRVLLRPDWLAT